MPANKPYPGENPVTARTRIAKNTAMRTNPNAARPKPTDPDAIKTKSDMMANIMPSAKNLGY